MFCFKYTRVVAADNTIRFGGQVLQLLPDAQRASYAKAEVEVHERLDGSVAVFHQGRCLATRPAPPSAPTLRARIGPRPLALPRANARPAGAPRLHDGPPPAANHPWRAPSNRKTAPAAPKGRQPDPPTNPRTSKATAPEP